MWKDPTVRPRATEHIGEIIKIVKDLVDSGHAYVARNGDVYFRVKSDEGYGKLSHLNLDDLESGNRTLRSQMDDDLKEDPADFAVWKAAKPGEPYWESPWAMAVPVGTLSAARWRASIWATPLTCMRAVRT